MRKGERPHPTRRCASAHLPLKGNTVNLRLKMAKRKDVEIE